MNVKLKIALRCVQEALNAINQTIETFDFDNSFTSVTQLYLFKTELERIKTEIETSELIPQNQRSSWMGKIICDGWPLEDSLGELIVKAENEYILL